MSAKAFSSLVIQAGGTRLYHALMKPEKVQECAYALTSLVIFPPEDQHFFSYSATQAEVSMILDRKALAKFPPKSLTVNSVPWRALSIFFGSSGWTTNSTSLISTVTRLLAAQNITIFYMSTSQSDLLLVHEKNLPTAIVALKDTFHIIDAEPSPEEDSFSGELTEELVPQTVVRSGSEPRMFVFRPNLEVTLHDQELCICSVHKESRSTATRALLKTIFYEKSFFSFTETEDEISLLLERRLIGQFPENLLTASEIYRPLERFAKADLNEVGVISALSAPISSAKIPMLYMSTFNSAYIMVLDADVQKAKMWLENAGYKFVHWKESTKARTQKPVPKLAPFAVTPAPAINANTGSNITNTYNHYSDQELSAREPDSSRDRSGSVDDPHFTQFSMDLSFEEK